MAAPPTDADEAARRLRAVERTSLFEGISPLDLRAVAQALESVAASPGEVVVAAGDRAGALYLVEDGEVQVELPGGQVLARLGAGEWFGEGALTGGGYRTATVRARTPARLWALDVEVLHRLGAAHPQLRDQVTRAAALRARHRAQADYGVDTETLRGVVGLQPGQSVRIGRDPGNDVVLGSRMVSRHHARISRTAEGLVLEDTSTDGASYVNGAPVTRQLLKEGDHVFLADTHLVLAGDAMATVVEPHAIRIDAVGLRKDVADGVNLIQDVSLSIGAGTMVAIVGGSGAGKSTLMDALSGVRPPTSGTVLFNGQDARAQRDRFRAVLGYVPQDDIIHTDLTVRATLGYAARLRLPDDTDAAARDAAVSEAMEALSLTPHADTVVSALSGGQRKRASIGVELLTEPRVFFLDEPTSGLDPATDTALMRQLRELSRRGSTVVLTTHATKNVRLCDEVVVLARGGHLAFAGPPDDALAHFEVAEFDEIYTRLEEEGTPEGWASRFAAVRAPTDPAATPIGPGPGPSPSSPEVSATRRGGVRRSVRQFATLSRRNAAVFVRNRDRLAPLFIQPVAFALLMVALFEPGLIEPDSANLGSTVLLVFLLPFSVFLFGLILGVQEIVTEFAIVRRERLVDLRVVPYVLSKLTLLAPALTVGSVLMLVVLRVTDRLPDLSAGQLGAVLVTMVLSVLVGLALALFTSSFAPNPQAANDLVLAWVMPQVLFAGGLFPIASMIGVGEAISVAMPLRYAFQAAAGTVDLVGVWEVSSERAAPTLLATYAEQFDVVGWTQWAVLGGIAVAFLALTAVVLVRRVPR
ncbi:ATP-binding cassette domain-containing protein [Euzebya sp.]|uniref:ATP-binding cassette domain-containing protein n=1 Tax=Euzebya sp. TaxID=1971409 RepID=UPI003518275F